VTTRATLVALTLALPVGLAGAALPPPPDALSVAYCTALDDLCAGKDRRQIADRLKPVVAANAASGYHKLVQEFLADLTESLKSAPRPGDAPEKRLADTRLPFSVLKFTENWGEPLKRLLVEEPNDPACQLMAAGRGAIDRLLPLLNDRSPTRAPRHKLDGRLVPHPRVCDVALAIIEYHAICRFHHDTIFGTALYQLPEDRRRAVVGRVGAWWQKNRDKSVAAGVRAQLPYAASYPEKVWMAKSLVRLGEGQTTGDKEFGIDVLRDMVREYRRSHVGAYAANALAELGDTSAVDVFYEEWKSWLGRPGLIHDSNIVFYLCAHGKRREWELLYAIAVEEVGDGQRPANGVVWAAVINSGQAETNPYALPFLGLALGQTETTGNRFVAGVGGQSFSHADLAAECLQKQLGKDFGYRVAGSEEERRAAIRQARQWWYTEGKAKYTFNAIEKNLIPAKSPACPP
jgi:hypothetical protein